jgi:hypothetical protein
MYLRGRYKNRPSYIAQPMLCLSALTAILCRLWNDSVAHPRKNGFEKLWLIKVQNSYCSFIESFLFQTCSNCSLLLRTCPNSLPRISSFLKSEISGFLRFWERENLSLFSYAERTRSLFFHCSFKPMRCEQSEQKFSRQARVSQFSLTETFSCPMLAVVYSLTFARVSTFPSLRL